METIQREDGTGIWRKPLDGVVFHGHRENTEPVTFEQKIRIEHGLRGQTAGCSSPFNASTLQRFNLVAMKSALHKMSR
jgi:hypothetical protein